MAGNQLNGLDHAHVSWAYGAGRSSRRAWTAAKLISWFRLGRPRRGLMVQTYLPR